MSAEALVTLERRCASFGVLAYLWTCASDLDHVLKAKPRPMLFLSDLEWFPSWIFVRVLDANALRERRRFWCDCTTRDMRSQNWIAP